MAAAIAAARPPIEGTGLSIPLAQPELGAEQVALAPAPHPAIAGAQSAIAGAQPDIIAEQAAISALDLLSFLVTKRKSHIR